jgi:hypothetical protein
MNDIRLRAVSFQPRQRSRSSPTSAGRNPRSGPERIDYLEKKIQTKDEVLAELMAEHVALKKTLGEL